MGTVLLYPKIEKIKGSPNPYIFNFQKALAQKHSVVTENVPNRGVLNLFLYFFKTKYFILNWAETIPEKRFGSLQTFFFLSFLKLTRAFKKKVIWILHNKGSHHKGENKKTKFMYDTLMSHSDHIITHSKTGYEFVENNYPFSLEKVHVIPHPVAGMIGTDSNEEKKYDLLIWGSIFKYKGIVEFLKFAKTCGSLNEKNILIIGRCNDQSYKKELLALESDHIKYEDKLLSLEEIAKISNQSKFTLFTYRSQTVLSSGSLIDAISMRAVIIGPNHGAFKDLNKYSFMNVYDDFQEIPEIMNRFNADKMNIEKDRQQFLSDNTWDLFIKKIEGITGLK